MRKNTTDQLTHRRPRPAPTARTLRSTAGLAVLVGSVLASPLTTPTAEARPALDVLDPSVDNVCLITGHLTRAAGATVAAPGLLTADALQVPAHPAVNACAT